MYAVVAPGFKGVFESWSDVERIKVLYPYPKWAKVKTAEEANTWLARNAYGRNLDYIYNYGDTFEKLHLDAKYRIGTDCIFYVIDFKNLGHLRITAPNTLVKYEGTKAFVRLKGVTVSEESLSGHLSAVYSLLEILGPYVDVNIELPYYSIFYALTSYSRGKNRYVTIVKDLITNRIGEVAYSLHMK